MKKSVICIELHQVLLGYEDLLEWLNSPKCFLTIEEKRLLFQFYSCDKDLKKISENLELSKGRTAEKIKSFKWRLEYHFKLYRRWQGEQMLQNWGIIPFNSLQDEFLSADLAYHEFSPRLYYSLSRIGRTLEEVFKEYTLDEIKRCRNFGKKSFLEFADFLKENCWSCVIK